MNNSNNSPNSGKRGKSRDETIQDLFCETYICVCYNIFIYLKDIFVYTEERYIMRYIFTFDLQF